MRGDLSPCWYHQRKTVKDVWQIECHIQDPTGETEREGHYIPMPSSLGQDTWCTFTHDIHKSSTVYTQDSMHVQSQTSTVVMPALKGPK